MDTGPGARQRGLQSTQTCGSTITGGSAMCACPHACSVFVFSLLTLWSTSVCRRAGPGGSGLAQVVLGTSRSTHGACMHSLGCADVRIPASLTLPTLRLTAGSVDRHAPVCVSVRGCCRLLCLYVHSPVFVCSNSSSVGRYGPQRLHDRPCAGHLCAGHLCGRIPTLCPHSWLSPSCAPGPNPGGTY